MLFKASNCNKCISFINKSLIMKTALRFTIALTLLLIQFVLPEFAAAQCGTLSATAVVSDSRCAATGSITINASGGAIPELYQYKIAAGPVTTAFTSLNTFAGLPPGNYSIIVRDVTANCSITLSNNIVAGNYSAPGVLYGSTGITCMNGSDGTIFVTSQTGGRAPFSYELIAPSPANVGTVSATGTFTGLIAGLYTVRLTDSCGGIQTRNQRVNNYSWSILPSSNVTKPTCQNLTVNVFLTNSNGVNSPNSVYNGFQYGISRGPGDTTWFPSTPFNFNIGTFRNATIVVKDACGLTVQSFSWADTPPAVGATVATSNLACTTFTATVTGQTNMSPASTQYCLYDQANTVLVSPCQPSNVFNNVPYGTYTIRINEGCFDTTILRTVTAEPPVPSVAAGVTISNKDCATFSAAITGQTNITNPIYRLFDAANNVQIGPDQSSPVFNLLPYGSYCIRTINDPACYDITFIKCFTVTRPVPSAAATVEISGQACATFNAAVTGLTNIYNPVYSLYDATNTTQIGADQSGPSFSAIPYGSYCIHIKNDPACYDTTIVRCFTTTAFVPSVGVTVTVSGQICGGFNATITGQTNMTNPVYSLYDAANATQIGSDQSSPVFNLVPYGSYCLRIKNDAACYDTTIVRCFNVAAPVPSTGPTVAISNQTCGTFTATITGQVNINNPVYSIYDGTNSVQIGTDQASPVFNLLPYGSYCIRTVNDPACYDTTIVRCFTVTAPVESVDATVGISNIGCTSFTATITGQVNFTNPIYSLYDAANSTQIGIDQSSAVFNSVIYGDYCIRIKNDPACHDTTIVRCFSVTKPVPSVDATVAISNQACATFTATITNQRNITTAVYSLYDAANATQIGADQASPVFNLVPNGSYCIRIVNNAACYDTTIVRCFTVLRLVPSVAATVSLSNQTCGTFTASVTGQTNISNPTYQLFNSANDTQIGADQSTPAFNGLAYGDYCIRIINDAACYDTTIVKCFTAANTIPGVEVNLASAQGTCALIGGTDITVTTMFGTLPFSYSLYAPSGALVAVTSANATSTIFASMPGLPTGTHYKVVIEDACGKKDSADVFPVVYFINRAITKSTKCPSGVNPDGTGDVMIHIDENVGGDYATQIIKKDGAIFNMSPTTSADFGRNTSFLDLAPGTYIFDTYGFSAFNCHGHLYDTVIVPNYVYPNLTNSKGYICESGLQSISSSTVGGALPYQYQIFSSLPLSPNINTAYQSNPIFDINNGTTYALVRLRVLDACGNASINDVGFVPVATPIIETTNDCFFSQTVLSVDTVANATYTWYKRTYNPIDSVLLVTGGSYTIPFLTIADTGTYICVTKLNDGCITRVSYRTVTGNCKASVGNWVWAENGTGPDANNGKQDAGENGLDGVTVNLISELGTIVATTQTDASGFYLFTDVDPGNYRIEVIPPTGYAFCNQTNTSDADILDAEIGSDFDKTTGQTYLFNLGAGESEMDIDAGLVLLSTLPVKLESFTAAPDGEKVQLRWNVSEELNMLYYEIEHSTTASNFQDIIGGVLPTNKRSYNLTDEHPVSGFNYYRLKSTDKNGAVSYSEIRKVNFGKTGDISVYPNPVRDNVNITFTHAFINKPCAISIYDVNGKLLSVKRITATSQTEMLDVSAYSNGKYIVRITTDTEVISKTIQIVK
jgi:hypothetical protein